jgi:hypothetical protein
MDAAPKGRGIPWWAWALMAIVLTAVAVVGSHTQSNLSVDPVTASRYIEVTRAYFWRMPPKVNLSAIDRRIKELGRSRPNRWKGLSNSEDGLFYAVRSCGSAPPIYEFSGQVSEGLVAALSDSELLVFVDAMEVADEEQQKLLVAEAGKKLDAYLDRPLAATSQPGAVGSRRP